MEHSSANEHEQQGEGRELTREEFAAVLVGVEHTQSFDPMTARMAMGQLYSGSYFDLASGRNNGIWVDSKRGGGHFGRC